MEGEQETERYGRVAFLNGGLFEWDADTDPLIHDLPNEAFDSLLGAAGLFYKYNFTVEETTPLDIEAAVDTKMLGKIFERLVNRRHDSGSYYTPRPIVSYMCREALKGYLEQTSDSQAVIEQFVEEGDASGIRDPENTLRALQRVLVVDPACGSGAYLLGMMHELVRLRFALLNRNVSETTLAHQRKTEIIQRNLYGVDKDRFATNIAKLRLWLSLIIEYSSEHTPPPLPNLLYRIETGDSVLHPLSNRTGGQGQLLLQTEEYEATKDDYFGLHDDQTKSATREEVDRLREGVFRDLGIPTVKFHWMVDFSKVFRTNDGFDIVLANPPYVRQRLIRGDQPALRRIFADTFHSSADLYTFFYVRGMELLRPDGLLVFISSHKWLLAGYGEPLRRFLAGNAAIREIIHFGDLDVFENTVAYPMVFSARKTIQRDMDQPARRRSPHFTQVTEYPPPSSLLELSREQGYDVPHPDPQQSDWRLVDAETLTFLHQMERMGTPHEDGSGGLPLGEYIRPGKIYYGIKTGLNVAFIIDADTRAELIARDPRSDEIIRPLANGDDVRKWHVRDRQRYLILTRIGVDMSRYPAVMDHLRQWEDRLRARADQGNHWWELRACSYYDVLEGRKIVYPEMAVSPRFTFDDGHFVPLKTAFSIPSNDLFLLGVLNTQVVWRFLENICPPNRGGWRSLQAIHVNRIPIPNCPEPDRDRIRDLVRECLDRRGDDCAEQETEIESLVRQAYGLPETVEQEDAT